MHYEKFADGTVKCIEDEIPFDVPDGWEWCRCRNIVDLFSGQDLEPQRYNSNGVGIPYITGASNLSGGHVIINRWTETPTTHATINDLLLTCKGSGVGKMAICDIEDAHIARQIMALRCTSAICLSYLQVLMSAFITEITYQANGIIPGIRREIVLETLFPLPPYNEQIQIGDRCSALTDLVLSVDMDQAEMLSLVGNIKAKILDLAIRGKLVLQDPDDEPASALLERIRAEKEELIKQGIIKRDKRESVIFRGEDNSYYEKVGNKELICVDDELPFAIPDGWAWCELQDCCHKEIKRGRSPKYADSGRVLSFAQKCNQKTGTINIGLALWIDDSTVSRYDDEEYMRDSDIVINSTGTGTLGRVGIYQNTDNPEGIPIVPDSHVTVVRVSDNLDPTYVFYYLKSMQSALEKMGEGSTNQKELKPISLQQLRIPIPPNQEQKRIVSVVDTMLGKLELVETNLI